MDERFTKALQAWIDTPKAQRDLAKGALLVLQANHSQIMYANFMRNPQRYADAIEYNVRKWLTYRLQNQTHAEVELMAAKVEQIASDHGLAEPEKQGEEGKHQTGKRSDHDQLPLEVQALYAENLDVLRRMREVHLRLRTLTAELKDGEMCPDSDRYPFLKELLELDQKYHDNWKAYDQATVESKSQEVAESKSRKVAKPKSRKAAKK